MSGADRMRRGGLGVLLGGAALLFAVLNVVGAQINRSLQSNVAASQVKLARAREVVQLDNALVQLLARAAAEKDDGAIRDLLARNGVTFRKTDASASTGAAK